MATTLSFRPSIEAAVAAAAGLSHEAAATCRPPRGSLPVSKWSGADLRAIRARNGVGRPIAKSEA